MSSPFVELVECICYELECQRIMYALTGSVVSSVYGEPFASQDVDICVDMNVAQAKRLATALPRRFYRSEDALVEAASRRTMSNLIDTQTHFKIDLCVLPNDPYLDIVIPGRRHIWLDPALPPVWAVSAEDIILMKLLWRKDSQSSKQWENALSVARVQREKLDFEYLRVWAGVAGVEEDLEQLLREASQSQ